jgi:hypothetical protein
VRGRWVEGRDLAELRAVVAAALAIREGARDAGAFGVLSIAPEDLSGAPPVLAFAHRGIWVPVFTRRPETVQADVAGQDVEASFDLPGVTALRDEVARLLRESGRLYDPLDLVVTGIAREVWEMWSAELGPADELPIRRGRRPACLYRYDDVTLAAVEDVGDEMTVWIGRDRFDLAARMGTRVDPLVGTG